MGGTPEIVGRTMKRAAGRPVAEQGLLFERFCHGEVQERTLEHSGFSSCGEACAPPSAALLLGLIGASASRNHPGYPHCH